MKKFKCIIAAVSCLYIILAASLYYVFIHVEHTHNNRYRVAVNRISEEVDCDPLFETNLLEESENKIPGIDQIFEIDKEQFSYSQDIIAITYLSTRSSTTELKREFYKPLNKYQMEITPVIQNDQLIGYLRFNYQRNLPIKTYLLMTEVFLLILYLFVMAFLIYTEINILKPFTVLSNVPYELSTGNLDIDMKESKNHYFGRFIWGIGMLKDTLNLHKKKELKLTRDKKMILLTISHDIKTPLNAIELYAKAIEQGMYPTEQEKIEAVQKIQEKADEINQFVREIVKTSTEDVVSIDVDQDAEFYMKDFVQKVNQGYKEKCQLRHLLLQMEDAPEKLVKGDIDRIYEAVGNLIENAMKYGDGQRISISYSEEEYCELIHVFNTGNPIDENDLPHLFDSFFRGSNVEGKQGNGLGLYICSEIMKKMNGDIYVKRHEDGMEFVLVCPIA